MQASPSSLSLALYLSLRDDAILPLSSSSILQSTPLPCLALSHSLRERDDPSLSLKDNLSFNNNVPLPPLPPPYLIPRAVHRSLLAWYQNPTSEIPLNPSSSIAPFLAQPFVEALSIDRAICIDTVAQTEAPIAGC